MFKKNSVSVSQPETQHIPPALYYGAQSKPGLLTLCATHFSQALAYAAGYLWMECIEPMRNGLIRSIAFRHFLNTSQWWTRAELEAYQLDRLQKVIWYAYQNVPYYKDLFNKHRIKPDMICSVVDLAKIPLLSKEDVIQNFDKLIATNLSKKERKKRIKVRSTSGSTGKQMSVCLDRKYDYVCLESSHWWHTMLGLPRSATYIRFWSRPFVDAPHDTCVFFDPYCRMVSLSSLVGSDAVFAQYTQVIQQSKPAFVCGAASFVYAFAQYVRKHKITDVSFDVFVSCYENLYSFQKKEIERQFNCVVYRHYGSEENLIFASECQERKGLHVDIRKGVMEVLDAYDMPVAEGTKGRLVCTGFANDVMPLIRYDIGDVGTMSAGSCPCGRGLPILESLDGRTSELLSINGTVISPATLSVVMSQINNIVECQFVQKKNGSLLIHVVRRAEFTVDDEAALKREVVAVVGSAVSIKINYCSHIARTALGKFRLVVVEK
jgi:phenylacetate-CoA ligase